MSEVKTLHQVFALERLPEVLALGRAGDAIVILDSFEAVKAPLANLLNAKHTMSIHALRDENAGHWSDPSNARGDNGGVVWIDDAAWLDLVLAHTRVRAWPSLRTQDAGALALAAQESP